jgi:hypothetical protein
VRALVDRFADRAVAGSAAELNELSDRVGELEGVEKTRSSMLLATKWSRPDPVS